MAALSENQVLEWREKGGVMVHGILEEDLLRKLILRARDLYPATSGVVEDFGATNTDCIFPSLETENACLNEIALHPKIIEAVAQLLGVEVDRIRLSQCELWHKRGIESSPGEMLHKEPANTAAVFDTSSNSDQRMHIDAFNHYLTFPPTFDKPEAVSMIVYYNDSSEVEGQTAIVKRQGPEDVAYNPSSEVPGEHPFLMTPGGRSDLIWINSKEKAEASLSKTHPDVAHFRATHLYPREEKMAFKEGSILFYRLDTWHRGTPVKPGKDRIVHNLVYKLSGCDHINSWGTGAARNNYTINQTVERIVATRKEAVVLGFPAPDSTSWDSRLSALTKARYNHLQK